MKRNTLITVILLLACICGIQAANKVKGNGKVVTRDIQVAEYDQIQVGVSTNSDLFTLIGSSKAGKVFNYKQVNGKATLQITLDENLFNELEITSTNGQLKIKTKEKTQISPTQLVFNGTSKTLTGIHMSGSTDFVLQSALTSDRLTIGASGSSDVIMKYPVQTGKCEAGLSGSSDWDANNLTCSILELSLSGASDVTLAGKAEQAVYSVSGGSDIEGYNFVVKSLECGASGGSDIQANATTSLKVSASGGSDINYKGSPKVDKSVSGGASVNQAN